MKINHTYALMLHFILRSTYIFNVHAKTHTNLQQSNIVLQSRLFQFIVDVGEWNRTTVCPQSTIHFNAISSSFTTRSSVSAIWLTTSSNRLHHHHLHPTSNRKTIKNNESSPNHRKYPVIYRCFPHRRRFTAYRQRHRSHLHRPNT